MRIGRDPSSEIVPTGPGSEVVSSRHLRCAFAGPGWTIEDLGSSNGTFVNGEVLPAGQPRSLAVGDEFRLGQAGPQFRVVSTERRAVAETMVETALPGAETAALAADATVPMELPVMPTPAAVATAEETDSTDQRNPSELLVVLRDLRDQTEYRVRGARIRLGRGKECEVRPLRDGDTVVSRVHAEICLSPDRQRAELMDARSRNGTLVNGGRIEKRHELKAGDRIELGRGGPELRVEELFIPGKEPAMLSRESTEEVAAIRVSADRPASKASAAASGPPRRSFGGKGRTMFMRELVHQTARQSSRKLRWFVWMAVVVLSGTTGGLLWWSDQRVRETTAALVEQQESLRNEAQTDLARLRDELEEARRSSAPVSVLDSLREALDSASSRTEALQASLDRAQNEMSGQLAAAERERAAREREMQQLATQLEAASDRQVAPELLDSLRTAMQAAASQVEQLDGQMRAVRGVNFPEVAQDNQGAVGLVSSFIGGQMFAGSGFVITGSGYFITNRHVVYDNGTRADSVFVTMADQRSRIPAGVVRISVAPGPDIAILRIQGYSGPYVRKVDWGGTRARQGEPAALIGFPTGFMVALDATGTVLTSMSAGIFSKVTADQIQFDGFTVGGSSGSPIFNASGEVVAVHRAGLRDTPGLAFAVPIAKAVRLLPAPAKAELGLPGG